MFLLLRENYLSRGIIRPCSIFPTRTTLMVGSNEGVYNCTLHIVPQLPHWWHAQRCLRIRVIGSIYLLLTTRGKKSLKKERQNVGWKQMFWLDLKYSAVDCFLGVELRYFSAFGDMIRILSTRGEKYAWKTRVCKNEDCFLSRPCWERGDGWQHLPVFVCANAKVAWHQQQNLLLV